MAADMLRWRLMLQEDRWVSGYQEQHLDIKTANRLTLTNLYDIKAGESACRINGLSPPVCVCVHMFKMHQIFCFLDPRGRLKETTLTEFHDFPECPE